MKISNILPLAIAMLVGSLVVAAYVAPTPVETTAALKPGTIRVLFLGHDRKHHNSNKYYPMLAKGLEGDAIHFSRRCELPMGTFSVC